MKRGPIIIIEDDADDKDLFAAVLKELKYENQLIWFNNCADAFQYLDSSTEQPFVIFCDVNLPKQTGTELKKQIDDHDGLRRKSIPFVFYSTSADQQTVNEAYTQMTVQGFFKKPNTYAEMKETIKLILEYWAVCKHPNASYWP